MITLQNRAQARQEVPHGESQFRPRQKNFKPFQFWHPEDDYRRRRAIMELKAAVANAMRWIGPRATEKEIGKHAYLGGTRKGISPRHVRRGIAYLRAQGFFLSEKMVYVSNRLQFVERVLDVARIRSNRPPQSGRTSTGQSGRTNTEQSVRVKSLKNKFSTAKFSGSDGGALDLQERHQRFSTNRDQQNHDELGKAKTEYKHPWEIVRAVPDKSPEPEECLGNSPRMRLWHEVMFDRRVRRIGDHSSRWEKCREIERAATAQGIVPDLNFYVAELLQQWRLEAACNS